ncbi:cytochrome c biogenesis protein CcmE [Thiocapsa imhoffii]|uniref:Cytochrome c-type biogenesis protein CcmE n=1 Tax=Thiocapsa imhoffii TaxID=382777 RepID=A0A9X0WJH9_9GAMM|nr:cytochrome c maturation protein CcmE [Thiocapsa imhoffii]MBK1645625.1 cytochrome c biogenesis protein CcmE [Thiocapsa imhoffii]
MKARQQRLVFVGLAIAGVGAASALAISALNSNLSYFFSPSQVIADEAPRDHVFRLGGIVMPGTVNRDDGDGLTVRFDVTDNLGVVTVAYTGILPDLFSEGQGVVTRGRLDPDGLFVAEEVLAKHDEEYMPPEVASTLHTAQAEPNLEGASHSNTGGASNP